MIEIELHPPCPPELPTWGISFPMDFIMNGDGNIEKIRSKVIKKVSKVGNNYTINNLQKDLSKMGLEISNIKELGGTVKKKVKHSTQASFRPLIIAALSDGPKNTKEVYKYIEKHHRILPGDLGHVCRGELRWKVLVRGEKSLLIKEGLMDNKSPKGVWKLA